MEENLVHRISSIDSKVKRLVEINSGMETKLQEISHENDILRRTIQSYEWQISDMKEQMQVLKIASSVKSDQDNNKAVKLKINELVREIDQCIAMITK